jgi:hypothetical protein
MIDQPRDDVYGPYDHSYLKSSGPKTHTQSPAVTGTSVIAVKFNGGVAMATDNLGMVQVIGTPITNKLTRICNSILWFTRSIYRRKPYPHFR